MILELLLALRFTTIESIGWLDADPTNLNDFINRNRGSTSFLQRIDKRLDAFLMPLVLTPEIHFAEPRPAETSELTKIVELKDTTLSKNFKPLLGKRFCTVGQILN